MRTGPKPKGGGSRFEVGDDGSIKERENATPQKRDAIGRRGSIALRISLNGGERQQAAAEDGGDDSGRRRRGGANKELTRGRVKRAKWLLRG